MFATLKTASTFMPVNYLTIDMKKPTHLWSAYAEKPARYFGNARRDYVDMLEVNPHRRILEIGCGAGLTGDLALRQNKCAEYCGVELDERAAATARERLTQVIADDVESVQLPWPDGYFHVLIMSELLEHLFDPWTTVQRLARLVCPGGQVMASSPNVSHHRVIHMLLRGRWDLTETGIMDATHLRWFTPATYREMFEAAGFVESSVTPVTPFRWKARCVMLLTAGRLSHLFISQINYRGRKPL